MVLCTVLMLALGLTVVATYAFTRSVGQSTIENVEVRRARFLAQSGIDYAIVRVWDDYLTENGGRAGSPIDYRDFLETDLGLLNGQEVGLDSAGWPTFSTGSLSALTVSRQDVDGVTNLTINSTAEAGGTSVTVTGVSAVEGAEYAGLEYGLFANNTNCTFCHAEIDSVQRYGEPYERVKIASLETLLLREGSADSTVAGTLYVRGQILDKNGDPLNIATLEDGTLGAYSFDSNGIIQLDQYGDKIPVPLVQAGTDGEGNLLPNANFYNDYPADSAAQTDGVVPEVFPNAFPDLNENRIIDNSEFDSVVVKAKGTLEGGIIHHESVGSTYSGTSLPATGNLSDIDTTIQGNVILKGTAGNPLEIDGRVVVDGDVVICGVIKGSGSVYARGNVYVVGDLTYDDGTDAYGDRTFGVADDGTVNKLGITAGANIIVGDYLTPRNGDIDDPNDRTTGDSGGDYGFTLSEMALFNRKEWQRTRTTLPGPGGAQVSNSTYIAGYIPRYYVQKIGDPVFIFTEITTDEQVYWDAAIESWLGKEHPAGWNDALTDLGDAPAGAEVVALEPHSSWISESYLKSIWIDERASHANNTPLTVDGLLYSSNAIFSLTRKRSNSDGELTVNGGILASDVGILAAGGLKLNYDSAVGDLLDVRRYDEVAFTRKLSLAQVKRID